MSPEPPCSEPEQKQLDFWVGDWNLTWPGQDAGETGHGTNSIKRILVECILQENFSSEESMHMRGISMSVYDASVKKRRQTWVGIEGGYLDFVGEVVAGRYPVSGITQRQGGAHPDGNGFQEHYCKQVRLELGRIKGWRKNLEGA